MAKEVDIDAIRRRIQALKQEADLQQEIFNNDKRRTTSLKKVQEIMEEIFRLQEEIDKELLKSDQLYKDITKSIAAAAKQERLLAIGGKDFFGMGQSVLSSLQEQLQTHKDIKAAQDVSEDLSTKINNIAGDIISKGYDLQGIEVSRLDIAKEIQKLDAEKDADLIDNLKGLDKVLVKEKNRLLVNKGIEKSMSAADGVLGGMAGKIKGFITNPLTIAVALLVAFNEQQETIAKEFGAIGVTEFRDELSRANREFVQLGLAGADSQKTISDLSNNFGIAFSEARKLAGVVGDISVTTGMSVDESTKLVGLFVKTQGLTADGAKNLLKQTQQLAKANDVAPSQILKDVANNTELFAKFAKDGGDNILRAAIQARKLGISLDTVAKISEGVLNFQDSLNKEIEASVILGRRVDLQRARELALAGKTEELQKEIVRQVGSEADFNAMNVFQRRKLAEAVNMEVSELQKLVSGQKQSVTLQGELAKQDISKMVPEETITGTANLINNMKILGMQLAEDIGPALNSVMGFFAGIASFLAENNAVLPVFIGMMGLMALKSIYTAGTKRLEIQATQELTSATLAQTASQEALNAAKDRGNAKTGATVAAAAVETGANKAVTGSNLARAGSNAAVGATKGSLALPFPFNILAAVTAAGTLITMIASIMSTSKGLQVGTGIGGVKKDTVEALHAGETVLNAEDTEMLRKQQAAIGGMRGTAASVDNKKLEENQQIANKTLEKMYTVLDDALGGARPRLATSLANATTDTLTV